MVGGGFQHEICSSAGSVPKLIEWDKTGKANISIHIDDGIKFLVNKNKKNYAWISESAAIVPDITKFIINNISYLENNFELIFTHNKNLVSLSNKIKLVLPSAVPWVKERSVQKKSKLISMIASTKIMCGGHVYRQKILEKYKHKIDCFGIGHNPINKKEEGLNNYCFSIAMENDVYPDYFTEKITDCFATGSVPIYWGTPSIGEFFNERGIIALIDDFKIEDLSIDLYYSKMEYILNNFERILELPTAEDYIYKNFIK